MALRHIRQLGLLLTLMGLCSTVVLLLFVRTHHSTSEDSIKGLRYRTAEHPQEGDELQDTLYTDNVNTFVAEQTIIQQQRLRRVQEGCSAMSNLSLRSRTFEKLPLGSLENFIVDDEYRLLYCYIPKVASTSWIRIFLVLKGVLSSAREGKQQFVHRGAMQSLRLLSSYKESEIPTILASYTKFLFVRNPFTRILSAFRNKMEPNAAYRGSRPWLGWIQRIKARYRNASVGAFGPFGPTAQTGDLTFAEFVRYIGDPRTTGTNKHWNSVVHRCHPCHVNYTFIGKIETIRTDARHILQLAKIDKLVSFPSADVSSPTNSSSSKIVQSYFAKVQAGDIKRLREKLKWDFNLFGYDSLQERHKLRR